MLSDKNQNPYWLPCPVCKELSDVKVYEDTVLLRTPDRWCKRSSGCGALVPASWCMSSAEGGASVPLSMVHGGRR